jgi:hypothetical protein
MKNLEDSIKYTDDKKRFQISTNDESHHQKAIDDLQKYLANQSSLGITLLGIQNLAAWHHWQFMHHFLADHNIVDDELAWSTYFALEWNNWNHFFCKRVDSCKLATPFHESIKHLAQMLYLGWNDKAVQYGHLLIGMLYGKQYKGGNYAFSHAWFMYELYAKWQHIELDKSKLHIPDSLGVYAKALAHWDTQDAGLLSATIDEMSAFHIQQSDEYVKTDKDGNEFGAEFSSSDYFVFPVEILMWLSIRRLMGLPEYVPSQDNALMQLEINRLPTITFPYPKDQLVEQCKQKLLHDNPGITFEF